MKNKLNIEIGRRLKRIRKDRGFSQEKMASILFIYRSMYQKYEAGTSSIPARLLLNCFTEMGISSDWLITGQGEMVMKSEKENLTNAIETTYFKEAGELLYYMEKIPMIRHSVLAHFQKLKADNGDIIQATTTK